MQYTYCRKLDFEIYPINKLNFLIKKIKLIFSKSNIFFLYIIIKILLKIKFRNGPYL